MFSRAVAALLAALAALAALTAAPAAANRTAPASAAAPRGDLPGWRLVYVDRFAGTQLNARWFGYSGVPGGDPAGRFATSHLRVGGGVLRIAGYRDPAYGGRFTTGGISSHALARTYGKWLVRFRVDAGRGISYAALLWPEATPWPPEIDFAEDNGIADRAVTTATLHYRTSTNPHAARHVTHRVAMTGWHVMGVEWRPGRLTYTMDGRVWARMSGAAVPRVPMRLALQTQAWGCGGTWERCPDRSTPRRVDLEVDWVKVYRAA